jgi:hypothetical protein
LGFGVSSFSQFGDTLEQLFLSHVAVWPDLNLVTLFQLAVGAIRQFFEAIRISAQCSLCICPVERLTKTALAISRARSCFAPLGLPLTPFGHLHAAIRLASPRPDFLRAGGVLAEFAAKFFARAD